MCLVFEVRGPVLFFLDKFEKSGERVQIRDVLINWVRREKRSEETV